MMRYSGSKMIEHRVSLVALTMASLCGVAAGQEPVDDSDATDYFTTEPDPSEPEQSEPEQSEPEVAREPSSDGVATFALHVSEAVQLRFPRVDGVPNTFSNVAGGGGLIMLRWVELSPQAHLIYSFTRVEVDNGGVMTTANASGLGWDAGMRIAVGAFGKPGNRFYAFAHPQFASWHLKGEFASGTTFDANVVEFATEFGVGIHMPVSRGLALDLFTSVVHLGFRPQEEEIVSVTSYPTIGVSVKARLGGLRFSTSSGGDETSHDIRSVPEVQ